MLTHPCFQDNAGKTTLLYRLKVWPTIEPSHSAGLGEKDVDPDLDRRGGNYDTYHRLQRGVRDL